MRFRARKTRFNVEKRCENVLLAFFFHSVELGRLGLDHFVNSFPHVISFLVQFALFEKKNNSEKVRIVVKFMEI